MTDKEQVIRLCKKLNLPRQEEEIGESVDDNKYHVDDLQIQIGSGHGYAGFYINLDFEADGNLIRHAIWK